MGDARKRITRSPYHMTITMPYHTIKGAASCFQASDLPAPSPTMPSPSDDMPVIKPACSKARIKEKRTVIIDSDSEGDFKSLASKEKMRGDEDVSKKREKRKRKSSDGEAGGQTKQAKGVKKPEGKTNDREQTKDDTAVSERLKFKLTKVSQPFKLRKGASFKPTKSVSPDRPSLPSSIAVKPVKSKKAEYKLESSPSPKSLKRCRDLEHRYSQVFTDEDFCSQVDKDTGNAACSQAVDMMDGSNQDVDGSNQDVAGSNQDVAAMYEQAQMDYEDLFHESCMQASLDEENANMAEEVREDGSDMMEIREAR